jgi:hypothetical protein
MAHAWLRHNVEEVGVLEHILPGVFAAAADAAAADRPYRSGAGAPGDP